MGFPGEAAERPVEEEVGGARETEAEEEEEVGTGPVMTKEGGGAREPEEVGVREEGVSVEEVGEREEEVEETLARRGLRGLIALAIEWWLLLRTRENPSSLGIR